MKLAATIRGQLSFFTVNARNPPSLLKVRQIAQHRAA